MYNLQAGNSALFLLYHSSHIHNLVVFASEICLKVVFACLIV
jgi:hypothetical protein